jgi:lipopolysaccharide transport system permease protein
MADRNVCPTKFNYELSMSTQVEMSENRLQAHADPAPAPAHAEPHETVIRPPRGWQLINLRELWHCRDLLFFLTWRDVKVRYKQTVLGVAWSVLQPALMMGVFTIFFSNIAKLSSGDLPYPVFVLAGLLPWTFFTTALGNAGNSVVGSEKLITKVYFPRLAIPFAAVGAAVVDFLIAMGLLAVLMLCWQVPPSPTVLLAPLVFALVVLAAAGFGTLLAALNVAYRDFRYVMPFVLQLWVFATPTVYMEMPPAQDGDWLHLLAALNPLTGLIAAFRAAVFGVGTVDWLQLSVSAVMVVGIFLLGCFYFRKVEDGFADII